MTLAIVTFRGWCVENVSVSSLYHLFPKNYKLNRGTKLYLFVTNGLIQPWSIPSTRLRHYDSLGFLTEMAAVSNKNLLLLASWALICCSAHVCCAEVRRTYQKCLQAKNYLSFQKARSWGLTVFWEDAFFT